MGRRAPMISLTGIGVSDGIAIGRAVVLAKSGIEVFRIPLEGEQVAGEIERLRSACAETRAEIARNRSGVGKLYGEELAAIFEAHLLLLSDRAFVGAIEDRIAADRVNAEWAVHEAARELERRFAALDDAYLRERGQDLEDVTRQLLRSLQGIAHHEVTEVEGEVVLVADDIVPSEAIRLGRANVVGFVIESGGRTSHTSIIARSLGIPAVAGIEGVTGLVTDQDPIVVDGGEGKVLLHPTPELLERFGAQRRRDRERDLRREAGAAEAARTADGVEIQLMANIDLPEELPAMLRSGARGIGLYRSEFLYMETDPRLPSEEDHFRIYSRLLAAAGPHPAVIRTYDLGGRKLAREMMESEEENPVLGLRGIRLTLARPQIFRLQLRGLLRAATAGNLWIMAPIVSRVEEVRALRAALQRAAEELAAEGIEHSTGYRLGIMVEVPAAALVADLLAREVDFFAIGTNDLIQYALAVDRNNPQVADLYQPFHPAILRMLRFVVESGRRAEIPVSLCGEAAADERLLPLLVGLGLRRLSVHPRAIPKLRQAVALLDAAALDRIAAAGCELASAEEVESFLRRELEALDAVRGETGRRWSSR
jgi:phosphotransferase system enzyme I (PtsI)